MTGNAPNADPFAVALAATDGRCVRFSDDFCERASKARASRHAHTLYGILSRAGNLKVEEVAGRPPLGWAGRTHEGSTSEHGQHREVESRDEIRGKHQHGTTP